MQRDIPLHTPWGLKAPFKTVQPMLLCWPWNAIHLIHATIPDTINHPNSSKPQAIKLARLPFLSNTVLSLLLVQSIRLPLRTPLTIAAKAVFAIDGRLRGTAPSNIVLRVDANLFVYTRPIDQINFYERGSFRRGSLTLTNIGNVNRNCKLESKRKISVDDNRSR